MSIACLGLGRPLAATAALGLVVLSGLLLGLAGWRAARLLAVARELRGDRRAIDEGVPRTLPPPVTPPERSPRP